MLDEGFPSPGFDASLLDPRLAVVSLRDFDASLVGKRTPDWYLYLRANEAGFDGLVTDDLSQSGQAEEMWTLTRTALSIVTWRHGESDPVVRWGQLMAYLPEIRRMIHQQGPSIVLLPAARLTPAQVDKASGLLGVIASGEGRSVAELRREAERSVREALRGRAEEERFAGPLAAPNARN